MPFQSLKESRGGRFMSRIGGVTKSYLGTGMHRAGMEMMKDTMGITQYGTGKLAVAGRALGIGFAGYTAYQGYQRGGITGAVGAVGQLAAENYMMGAAIRGVFGSMSAGFAVMAPLAIGAGAAYGRAKAHTIGKERYRRHAGVEMGTPVVDPFGSAATMRQRSLQALNNSRLNGMTALGNEAQLMYRPYHR